MPFESSADFFQNLLFQKIISGTLTECQTVWIQIRTDILSVLIWVQTVCKGYQQTTKVAASKGRVGKILKAYWERSGSVVECLTRDRGAAGFSLTGVTALCP